ncbi:hypothetical protein ACFXTO_046407 [Malus domestica]
MNNTVAAQLTLFSLDQPLNSGQLFPNDDLVPSSPELQVLSMATLLPPSFCCSLYQQVLNFLAYHVIFFSICLASEKMHDQKIKTSKESVLAIVKRDGEATLFPVTFIH